MFHSPTQRGCFPNATTQHVFTACSVPSVLQSDVMCIRRIIRLRPLSTPQTLADYSAPSSCKIHEWKHMYVQLYKQVTYVLSSRCFTLSHSYRRSYGKLLQTSRDKCREMDAYDSQLQSPTRAHMVLTRGADMYLGPLQSTTALYPL